MDRVVTDSPPADPTPRRRVAQRIDRFLRGLQRARRQPNRREGYHLRDALEHLAGGQVEACEASVLRAERMEPLPASVAALLATNETITVAELASQLDRIINASEGSTSP
jgi:hypothetical protein